MATVHNACPQLIAHAAMKEPAVAENGPEATLNALRLHASPANEQQRVSRHRSMLQLVGEVALRS